MDAMGGDFAPAALVQGALRAVAEHEIRVLLVGDTDRMQAEMNDQEPDGRVELVHAGQIIEMTEAPTAALRQKPDASLIGSVRLVKEGRADAVISAGNTGAFFAGSLLTLGRLPITISRSYSIHR